MQQTKKRPVWDVRTKKQGLRLLMPSALFLGIIAYQELFLKLYCFQVIPVRGVVWTVLFSIPIALLLGLWCCAVRPQTGRRVLLGVTAALCAWMATQTVYFHLFKTFLSVSSLLRVKMVAGEFGGLAVTNTIRCWFPILVECLPFGVAFALRERIIPQERTDRSVKLRWAALAVMLQMAVTLAVVSNDNGALSLYHIYNQSDAPELTVTNFGVLTNTRLELKRLVFGVRPQEELPEDWKDLLQSDEILPGDYPQPGEDAQVMDIDFEALVREEKDEDLAAMHDYFARVEPTNKNQWTGYFEGKNLIWIVAEAFSSLAVDPELTPTLYRLSNEGFVFNNFYTPLWGLSTSDGEYVTTTGLIPKAGAWSYLQSAENHMPFGFGNLFSQRGYRTLAYHNNTYTYYGRDLSHPNLGYDYYGIGNGLDVATTWPESDLEMMEKTIPQALAGEKPFHNYYMTVSGHMNYNFQGNAMSKKHKEALDASGLSEPARAYLACHIELDQALAYVLEQLEAAGELENTVICMSGDHYPYGLDGTGAIDELTAPGTEADLIEKYHSTLILWSGDMTEPVVVEKPCSSIDVVPTLLNLFGMDYDSRLIIGRDILSDSPGLVTTNKKCFVTDLGRYYSNTDTFIPNEGATVPEGYVQDTYKEVQRMFTYSERILFNDYYRKLGLNPGTPPPVAEAEPVQTEQTEAS